MMGSDHTPGVIPLAVEDVFQTIKNVGVVFDVAVCISLLCNRVFILTNDLCLTEVSKEGVSSPSVLHGNLQ